MAPLWVCSWGEFWGVTSEIERDLGEALTGMVGIVQENIVYSDSTSYCSSGLMDHANIT